MISLSPPEEHDPILVVDCAIQGIVQGVLQNVGNHNSKFWGENFNTEI